MSRQTVWSGLLSGLLTGALVLAVATFAARQLLASETYSKSRLISMIVSQDEVDIGDIAGNKDNVDLLLRFVGGLTSAYIDFELIPVGEVSTFVAIFESVQGQAGRVEIEKFEYHRKNLTITGTAASEQDYGEFLTRLRDTEHFAAVSGHFYLTTGDAIRFTLECTARHGTAALDFG